MFRTARPLCYAGCTLVLLLIAAPANAQTSAQGFVTGQAAQAFEHWQAAMQAILDREAAKADSAFGEVLAMEPSPFRIALLADYTVSQTPYGGAVLLFEQDQESKTLGPNGQQAAELLDTGREQMNQADDGFYFAQIGRFDVSQANFRALLQADPDPVAVLEFTDRVPRRRDILLQLVEHPVLAEEAKAVLRLLDRGELLIKSDPTRIKENIERLGGPPRAFENAVAALRDSGEMAAPFLIQYLRDPQYRELTPAILRALPQIDRPAVNPLVMALRMDDDAVKRYVIEALAKIGHSQATPYLLQLVADPKTSAEVRSAAEAALSALQARGAADAPARSAADAFLALAEAYYAGKASLAADPRLDTANVWYWRDDLLQNVEVPTVIFNEVMCLRCCEEALRLEPALKPALSLWIAANLRREAQLPEEATDFTRPDNYPPAAYFAQSAGAEYCLASLARAVDAGEPAVALGSIEALFRTAGPASLVTDAGGRLPLAEALSFPDRMVRIRAGLTLANARPRERFRNYQNLMPVLVEALMLHAGGRNALVVDPDAESANAVAAALRGQGLEVLIDSTLPAGLQRVRDQAPGVDLIVLASDMASPVLPDALAALRGEFRFAAVPVVIVTKQGDSGAVRDLDRADPRVASVPSEPSPEQMEAAVTEVGKSVGARAVTPEIGAELAKQSAEMLRALALTNNPVFDIADAETALLVAFKSQDLELRLLVAEVLGYLASSGAQEAIAGAALDTTEIEDVRVKMFTALAEAAKRRGNLLGDELVRRIIEIVQQDENMTIREAASRALGALNLPSVPASEIIRAQYRG